MSPIRSSTLAGISSQGKPFRVVSFHNPSSGRGPACQALGLEGRANALPEPVTAYEFAITAEEAESFRRLCRPEVEALYADAQATDSIVILTNASGLILDTVGSPDFAQRAAQVALRPGVPWSEQIRRDQCDRHLPGRRLPYRGARRRTLSRMQPDPELLGHSDPRSARQRPRRSRSLRSRRDAPCPCAGSRDARRRADRAQALRQGVQGCGCGAAPRRSSHARHGTGGHSGFRGRMSQGREPARFEADRPKLRCSRQSDMERSVSRQAG